MAEVRPYGAWPSPIGADLLVAGAASIGTVVVDGDDVWWDERRPDERGRTAVVRWRAGTATEITRPDDDVRTLVHEYGGGAWWAEDGRLWAVSAADQRLWRQDADGRPTPDGAWFACVRERHDVEPGEEPRNELVRVASDGSLRVDVLVSGPDFVASPRPSPDGTRLAWIQWDHPNMPWDDTELWVAELADVPGTARRIAGGPVAYQQPQWGPDGALYVLADLDDRWAVHRVTETGLEPVLTADGEIGHPAWGFGGSSYAFRPDGGIAAVVTTNGVDRLDGADGAAPWASSVEALRWQGDQAVAVAAAWDREAVVVRGDPVRGGDEVLRPARDLGLDPALFPAPELLTFPTSGGEQAHAVFYAPANPDVDGPPGERPPLLVLAHGGPTGAARTALDLGIRYWTSRGIAVVDVNYRGSTGFGRAYRHRLHGQWGGPRHPQVRGAVPRSAHRAIPRRARPLPGPQPHPPRRPPPHAHHRAAGSRGRDRAPQPVRGDRRRAQGQRGPPRLPAVPGRAARLPAGRHHRARPRGRARVLPRGVGHPPAAGAAAGRGRLSIGALRRAGARG
ncbi:MAG: prolyl oligopeptidase family serine peptidase [Acidimicrobiales bacterium]|nr:prolyl oligopeptidase family serine peptidase [Acidimicrobiales bacterium]